MGVRRWRNGAAAVLLLVAAGAVCPGHVWAGEAATQPPADIPAALRDLASRAGVVFVGRVTGIERTGGVVQVHFDVEQTIEGAAGATYTLREWAGLWPPGQYRYVAGQHVVIFLNPAGSAGLSTPVDGMDGVLPVVVQGASAPELVDVRRLAASILRAPGIPLDGSDTGALLLTDVAATVSGWKRTLIRPMPRKPLPVPYRPGPGTGELPPEPSDPVEPSVPVATVIPVPPVVNAPVTAGKGGAPVGGTQLPGGVRAGSGGPGVQQQGDRPW